MVPPLKKGFEMIRPFMSANEKIVVEDWKTLTCPMSLIS